MFLLSYKNTRESLGELGKAVETLACQIVFPQQFFFSQTSTCVLYNLVETLHVFYFLNGNVLRVACLQVPICVCHIQ